MMKLYIYKKNNYKIRLLFMLGSLYMTISYAQINVRNDNYLFIKDEVIFVNDNINLQEADSKMYFRDGAQLIQGIGTTGNSGIGQLSIYQNGTTHNYAYNYWCSPVGNNSAAFGNEHFTTNLLDDATSLITSNNAAFTLYDGIAVPLTIASHWIYTFETSDEYNEWIHRGDVGTIAPGLGFTMKGTSGSGNNQLYDFRGKANNGTITNTVSTSQWTLVGNPYPSAIDALTYIHDVDNIASITGTLYYWEQDLSVMSHYTADYVGGYATYTINATGTVETFIPATFNTYNSDGTLNTTGSASTSGKQARRYIAIGQGFMVEGSNPTTGMVFTKNTHRTYYKESEPESEFFRIQSSDNTKRIENSRTFTTPTHPYGLLPSDYKRFRLNIDFNDTYTRQLVHTFHDTEATYDFDYGLESKSPFDVENDVYWEQTNTFYVAQALPFDINMSIPLYITLNTDNTIRIRIFDIQHFDANQGIYVHDKENGSYTNIREIPFETSLSQGEYANRFEIVFATNTLGNSDITAPHFSLIQNTIKQELIIKNPDMKNIKSIYLYDLLGKTIWSDTLGNTKSEYTIDISSLSDAVYVAKIHTTNHETFIKKIILKN